MKTHIQTDLGRINFQSPRIQKNVKNTSASGSLSVEMKGARNQTEVRSHWSTPKDTTHASVDVYDQDGRDNLQLKFIRRRDLLFLNVANPGAKNEKSSISIPLGETGDTKDKFFSRGFFPASGISDVHLSSEKDSDGTYSVLEVRRGQDTQVQSYRVDAGKIYEIPYDAGFRGYKDIYG